MKNQKTASTVAEAVQLIKQGGVNIDNADLIKIMNYINEYEPSMKLTLEYNNELGKTKIIKK